MIDEWKPSASIDILRKRDQIITKIRTFFKDKGYLEVDTPIMAQHGVSDVYLSNIKATFRRKSYCLQTSPEYHMKRLLAAGSGPIFQMGHVFRDDELGRWHNPEFTLLEWYKLDVDHHGLMAEVEELLSIILGTKTLVKISYQKLFQEYCQIDPLNTSVAELNQCLNAFQLNDILKAEETDHDQYLFLLLTHVIEPAMKDIESPIAVYDYPASQASLAKINHHVGERFEIYYHGIELANGFHELGDADLQSQRFEEDNRQRSRNNFEYVPPDPYLLKALEHGLPACSGVALGVDRLIALALEQPSIDKVLTFDVSRA